MLNWERRIRHINRRVKPTAMVKLGLRGQLLKAKVKERRGLPSRNLPAELVFERVRLKFMDETRGPDAADRIRRLHRSEMHERLMERKRRQRAAARRRARPPVGDTCIYLWRRRQEWLRTWRPPSATPANRTGDVATMRHPLGGSAWHYHYARRRKPLRKS